MLTYVATKSSFDLLAGKILMVACIKVWNASKWYAFYANMKSWVFESAPGRQNFFLH